MSRARQFYCHDCRAVLVDDDRLHYVYQCHACVMIEHERIGLAARDPDHPDAELLGSGAVDVLTPWRPATRDPGRRRA